MTFFANFNRYGSDTSVGFLNTNEVIAFQTRADRNAWVNVRQDSNLSVHAITAAEARRRTAPEWDGRRTYLTPEMGCVRL